MARKISHTLSVAGRLVALSPLHVGGAEEGPITDMALAVDGLGRYYIPGTSLAGAIRAFCKAEAQDRYWGFAAGNDEGTASHVLVDDAPATEIPDVELWHGNGIDRRWGTAAQGIKYDREILPRGTALAFRLTLEVTTSHEVNERRGFLAWLVRAMESGEVPFGASTTRGLGRARLADAHCSEHDWGTREGILKWISGGSTEDRRAAWEQQLQRYRPKSRDHIRMEIHWRPKGPLMSRSAREGVLVDGMPFVSHREGGNLALTLPGSGIKGAWRGHAERIVRTVLGVTSVPEKHHEQVDVPLAADLFGLARPTDPKPGKPAGGGRHKGRLAFETCYARFALPARQWDELERNDGLWNGPPNSDRPMAKAMHVAVDRWTGGAAESLLYSAVEPIGVTWEPLVLHLNAAKRPLAELALLWLTLRDFCAGRIPLGFGVNRGYGDLEVERVVLHGLASMDQPDDQAELKVSSGELDETPVASLVARLRNAWSQWLESQPKEAAQ